MDIPLGAAFINVVAYVFAALIITLEIPSIDRNELIQKYYVIWGEITVATVVFIPLYVAFTVEGG